MSGCPTPWKIPYESRRVAIQANRSGRRKTRNLKPYRCGCGSWHLTHLTKRMAKQVARRRNIAA